METFEILTSESQERMLAIVRPEDVEAARAVCRKWGLEASAVATFTEGETLTVRRGGEVVASIPAPSLADEGPEYDRAARRPDWLDALRADDPAAAPPPAHLEEAFLAVLGSPNVAAKRWAFEQYDSIVQGQTVVGPGADAAVIRIEGTLRAVAVSSDGNGRYGRLDPYLGAAHAVAESARNVACGRRAAGRDHQLPELRQPGAAGGHVAVRGEHPRPGRRVPGARHAGHRRQRVVLQRVRRVGHRPDAGHRDARHPGRLPAAGAERLRGRGARDLRAGHDAARAGRERVRGGGARARRRASRRRWTWRRRRGCTGCWPPRRAPTCSPRRTTARAGGSRSRSPRRASTAASGSS